MAPCEIRLSASTAALTKMETLTGETDSDSPAHNSHDMSKTARDAHRRLSDTRTFHNGKCFALSIVA